MPPGLREFGEDAEIDRLIRKYGYRGTARNTQGSLKKTENYKKTSLAATHLIRRAPDSRSTEGRFKVTYATGHLTQAEIESVGYQWAPVNEVLAEYNPETLVDGFNGDFFYISEPGQGLWALRSRFNR